MESNIFEIYLTSNFIESDKWLSFIYKMSKINGLFHPWILWINIENNYIRYFVETEKTLPPLFGNLGSFLFKKTESNLKQKSISGKPYLLTKNYKTLLDIYDKNETKKFQELKNVKIIFYPYKYDNYLSSTYFYFKDSNGKIIKRKVFGNDEIYKFISIDFGIHTRFFYQKNEAKYLETKKYYNI